MRILHIRFQNLNSLAGEWEIDLTHPEFEANGIFAITGPTGAGKSTLLDAICLALYGRTPRLAKIAKSGNEIMSRQTGECFAEVTFETLKGRYRCHWSQRRAHRKADGELQPARHEISDAHTGKLLDASLRGVAERIESVSGMDYERFTRSMLLAQGGFAAFLQAAPDHRGPILEQITGTEIYSRLSMAVHERRAQEQARLDAMQGELAGMRLLDAEQEAELNARLHDAQDKVADLAARIQGCQDAIAWRDALAQHELALAQAGERQIQLRQRQQAFVPEREILANALRALELEGSHAALALLRQAITTDRSELARMRDQIPEALRQCAAAQHALQTADTAWQRCQERHHAAKPLLVKIRALDVRIMEQQLPIAAADNALKEEEAGLRVLQTRQNEEIAQLAQHAAELNVLRAWQGKHAQDAHLERELAALQERLRAWRDARIRLAASGEALAAAQASQAQAAASQQAVQAQLLQARQTVEAASQALSHREAALAACLEGRSLAQWRAWLSRLERRGRLLEKSDSQLQLLQSVADGLGPIKSRLTSLSNRSELVCVQLQAQRRSLDQLSEQHVLMQSQVGLLRRIASLEQERQSLRNGEPCPLCGSREHPYAKHGIPAQEEANQALITLQAELAEARESVTRMAIEQAELAKDRQRAALDQANLQANGSSAANALSALLEQLRGDGNETLALCGALEKSLAHTVFADDEAAAEITSSGMRDLVLAAQSLTAMMKSDAQALRTIAQVLDKAEAAMADIAGLRLGSDRAQTALGEVERSALSAQHSLDTATDAVTRLQEELRQANEEATVITRALRQRLEPFGVDVPEPQDAATVWQTLQSRQQAWQAQQERLVALEQDMARLQQRQEERRVQIQGAMHRRSRMQTQRDELTAARDDLLRLRRDEFGELDPDEQEGGLLKEIDTARQARDEAQQCLQVRQAAHDALQARQKAVQDSLARHEAEEALQAVAFESRLTAAGFADEAALLAARLPEGRRRELSDRAEQLDREQAGLLATIASSEHHLAQLRSHPATELSREALQVEHETLRNAYQGQLQALGQWRGRLQDNDQLKQTQRGRIELLHAQQRECERWNQLHQLIGSADGKKFRNFAQGLTFELMVAHANRQLQEMTDRYLLLRDAMQPLELNVIDGYQAGEIRSTKNLSGGESFIVSLALALGLSAMASHNVRVDSLFLDEGFGTLDEDALDTALSTLAGLQQAGKLIGVISHVAALKERIGTQIQVWPETGGRSRLSGPGCRRID